MGTQSGGDQRADKRGWSGGRNSEVGAGRGGFRGEGFRVVGLRWEGFRGQSSVERDSGEGTQAGPKGL